MKNSVLLFTFFFFLGCSSGDIAGGSTTETTNGFVVLTSAGTPAVGAEVTFVDRTHWFTRSAMGLSPAIDSAVTDHFGRITHLPPEKSEGIQIETDTEAIYLTALRDTVLLKPKQSLQGTYSGTADSVKIAGTTWGSALSQGNFAFQLPSGIYSLTICDGTDLSLAASVHLHDSVQSIVLAPMAPGVLFDDFNGGFGFHPLSEILDTVWWYTFSDSVGMVYRDSAWDPSEGSTHGGNSSFLPEMEQGTLRITARLGDAVPYPFAGLGVTLYSEKPRGYNLSKMTHLQVKARGNGRLEISMETDTLDQLGTSQYHNTIELNNLWQEFRIPVDSFHLDEADSLVEYQFPWSEAAKNIESLEFIFVGADNSNDSLTAELEYLFFEGAKLPL